MKLRTILSTSYTMLLFLVCAVGLFILSGNLIKTKNTLAEKYLASSNSSQIPSESFIFLMESNLLSPDDSKKVKIIEHYSDLGDQKTVEFMLKTLRSKSGLKTTSSYFSIKGDSEKALIAARRVGEEAFITEISDFQKVSNGTKDIRDININTAPVSEPGRIISGIQKMDFTNLEGSTKQTKEIHTIFMGPGNQTGRLLKTADYLIKINQPRLALFLLESIEKKFIPSVESLVLRASALQSLEKNSEALKIIKVAIKKNPSNINLVERAISLARLDKNILDTDYYTERLRYLKALSR